jgi:hypothetical protein
MVAMFNFEQLAYRGRNDDGTQATATFKENENTPWTQAVDENFRVRFVGQEIGGATGATDMQLQYDLDGGGFLDVTTVSAVVRAVTSPNVADGTATTDQMTAGSGTFAAGTVSTDGLAASVSFAASGQTQWEFVLQIVSADATNGQTITLRGIYSGDPSPDYTQSPSITVSEAVGPNEGAATVTHSWALSAVGETPAAGPNEGSATVTHAWAITATSETDEPVGRVATLPWYLYGAYNYNAAQGSLTTTPDGVWQYAVWVGPGSAGDNCAHIARRRHGHSWRPAVDLSAVSPTAFPGTFELDSHNWIVVAVDNDGTVHISGDHHTDPLNYMTANAELTSFATPGMIGTEESSVTYPRFFKIYGHGTIPDGTLFFVYRDGTSGAGDWILNRYSTATDTWARVAKIFDRGVSPDRNAYPSFSVDPSNGRIHSTWTWRESGGAEGNEDICYGYSADGGATWRDVEDNLLSTPIVFGEGIAVDTTIVGGGPILNGSSSTVDGSGRPHLGWRIAASNGSTAYRHRHIYWDGAAWQNIGMPDPATSGQLAGGPPDLVTWPDNTMWALFRGSPGPEETGRRLRYFDITNPAATAPEAVLVNADLRDWTRGYDEEAFRVRDELHWIIAPVNDDGELAPADVDRIPNAAVVMAVQDSPPVTVLTHRHGPSLHSDKTTIAAWEFTPGFDAKVGDTIYVQTAYIAASLPAVSDSAGNTWTPVGGILNSDGDVRGRGAFTIVTSAFGATDTITVTTVDATTPKAATVDVFGGVRALISQPDGAVSGPSNPSTSGAIGADRLLVGAVAVKGPVEETITEDADELDGLWSPNGRAGTTGDTSISNRNTNRQYKVTTAASTQTYDPTLDPARHWATRLVEFSIGGQGSATVTHAWALSAVGEAPSVGASEGSATVAHAWAVAADGEAPTVGENDGSATVTHAWTVMAAGEATHEGIATVAHAWVLSAAGEATHEGVATVAHAWAISAAGEAPVEDQQSGSATIEHAWAIAATGETAHGGSATVDHTWVIAAVSTLQVVGLIVGAITGPAHETPDVDGPDVHRAATGPATRRVLTGAANRSVELDGPSHQTPDVDGPDTHRTITGPRRRRVLTGPGV